MKWAYGVTTVPKRYNELLPRTLQSLEAAGFNEPRIYVDGMDRLPRNLAEYRVSYHDNIGTFGNWVLAAWDLYARTPHADLYAIFQDDLVARKGLREYLEYCKYPKQGYWNLYTFPHNTKPTQGWYPSDQLGKGAVGLVFDNVTLRTLLSTRYMVDRPLHPQRGHRYVDGGIVSALKGEGYLEYVHNPSLLQHTGEHSSMGSDRQPLATSFQGEDFNAMDLVAKNKPNLKSKPRLGLVGYNCNTGLGELNRQLLKYVEFDTWLIKPHPKVEMNILPDNVDCIICNTGNMAKIDQFIKAVDIIVFCEMPFYNELVPMAKAQGKRLVCVPMLEWFPVNGRGWPEAVDLFICPTQQCYDQLKVIPGLRCEYFPWPVDVDRYPFQQREACNRFLFLGGHGGYKGRKGVNVVKSAKRLWSQLPLSVSTQVATDWPPDTTIVAPTSENYELYSRGDVLISPHSVDGLGLEPMEAMACGMPVVSTNGLPWNEIPAIRSINSAIEKRIIRNRIDWHLPDPSHLVEICKELLGENISCTSQQVRQWAEGRDWKLHREKFEELVYGKVHSPS